MADTGPNSQKRLFAFYMPREDRRHDLLHWRSASWRELFTDHPDVGPGTVLHHQSADLYALLKPDGTPEPLPTPLVRRIQGLSSRGRPELVLGKTMVSLSLSQEHLRLANKLGRGNVSAGIRAALDLAENPFG